MSHTLQDYNAEERSISYPIPFSNDGRIVMSIVVVLAVFCVACVTLSFSIEMANSLALAPLTAQQIIGIAELSECNAHKCSGHGECRRRLSAAGVLCNCRSGWTGDNCDTPSNSPALPCSTLTSPCRNQGECYNLNTTDFLCLCKAGYTGTHCDDVLQASMSNHCHHGNCTEEGDHYSCLCDRGYEGEQCQHDIDDCKSNWCGDNGTCIDLHKSHICICDHGYTGSDCHSVCDDEPCFNGGTCTLCEEGVCHETGLPFICTCSSDIYGVLCTDRDGSWTYWTSWAVEISFDEYNAVGTNIPLAQCSVERRRRHRKCQDPIRIGNGSGCQGESEENGEIIDATCYCIRCCEGLLSCVTGIDSCECNVLCRNTSGIHCCEDQETACSDTRILTLTELISQNNIR